MHAIGKEEEWQKLKQSRNTILRTEAEARKCSKSKQTNKNQNTFVRAEA